MILLLPSSSGCVSQPGKIHQAPPPLPRHSTHFSKLVIAQEGGGIPPRQALQPASVADTTGIHVTQIKRNEGEHAQPSLNGLKKLAATLSAPRTH
jgi:hypothetical protein